MNSYQELLERSLEYSNLISEIFETNIGAWYCRMVSVNGKSIEAFLPPKCGITEMPRLQCGITDLRDALFESASYGRHDTVLAKSGHFCELNYVRL